MFKSVTMFSDYSLIYKKNFVTVPKICGLEFSLVEFDGKLYHDDLFDYYGVFYPSDLLNSAVIKRRAEYLAGRYAAQQLLRNFDCNESVVMGNDGSPQWPLGWRGSISHTNNRAIAVISSDKNPWRPGIDIENFRLGELIEIADLFVTSQEQGLLALSGIEYELSLLLAFSVKESFYKSLYPQVKCFFGFDCVEIDKIEPHHQRVILRLTQTLAPQFPAGLCLFGYYQIRNNVIVTLVI